MNIYLIVTLAVVGTIMAIFVTWLILKNQVVITFITSHDRVVVVFATLLLAVTLSEVFYFIAEQKTEGWFIKGMKYGTESTDVDPTTVKNDYRHRLKVFVAGKDSVRYLLLQLPETQNCRVARMHEQLTDVTFRAYNHIMTAREFMVQSYVCISIASIFYALSFVGLVYATKGGWDKTKSWILVFIISSTAIASLFLAFTNIFTHTDNVSRNFELYAANVNLEQQIRSVLALSDYVIRFSDKSCKEIVGQPEAHKEIDSLIYYFDRRMTEINRVEMGFDPAGVMRFQQSLEASKANFTK